MNSIKAILLATVCSTSVFAEIYDNKGGESIPMGHEVLSEETVELKYKDFSLNSYQPTMAKKGESNNVKRYGYSSSKTYKIFTRLNTSTTIRLPIGEEIQAYTLGDEHAFQVTLFGEKLPNMLNIQSVFSNVDTNMTVIGASGNIYNFYVKSEAVKTKTEPDFTVFIDGKINNRKFARKSKGGFFGGGVSNSYFEKGAPSSAGYTNPHFEKGGDQTDLYEVDYAAISVEEGAWQAPQGVSSWVKKRDYLKTVADPQKINIRYSLKGEAKIAPFAVYDDRKWTYFDFRGGIASDRLPVIHKVIDGYDSVVNTRWENGYLIAESLSPEGWTLTNGESVICVRPDEDLGKKYRRKPKTIRQVGDLSKLPVIKRPAGYDRDSEHSKEVVRRYAEKLKKEKPISLKKGKACGHQMLGGITSGGYTGVKKECINE